MLTLLKSPIVWFGLVAIVLTAIEGIRLWLEERKKSGSAARGRMLIVIATAVVAIASLAASNLSQSASEMKAQAAQKSLTDSLTNFGIQAKQFGQENEQLRSQLGGQMSTLGGQLDQNVKVMEPHLADLTFGFMNLQDKTFKSEITITPWSPGSLVAYVSVRNYSHVNAVDAWGIYVVDSPLYFPPNTQLHKEPLGLIAAGGMDGKSLGVPIHYPPGSATIKLRMIGKCDACGPTHEQILTIHVAPQAPNPSSLQLMFTFPSHPNRSLKIEQVKSLTIHLKTLSGSTLDLAYSNLVRGAWYEFHEVPVGSHTPPVNNLAAPLPSNLSPGTYYVTEITGTTSNGDAIRVCAESPEIVLPEGKDRGSQLHKAQGGCADYISISSITKQ
jgi:hypothetical protein